jgi:hypothetical protein
MSRLATIDMDVSADEPPPEWTDDWVRHRLIEAYRIEQRLPGARRQKFSGLWPAHPYEFADVVGWDDARERVWEGWSHANGGVYAEEISRMDEAQEWLRVELAKHPGERVCLAAWAACVAYKYSLRSLVLRKKWSRSTFYRRVVDGSKIITCQLIAADVEVK